MKTTFLTTPTILLFTTTISAFPFDLTTSKGQVLNECTITAIDGELASIKHSRGVGKFPLKGLAASGTSNEVFATQLANAREKEQAINSAPKATLATANEWKFPSTAFVDGETLAAEDLASLYRTIKRHYAIGDLGTLMPAFEISGTVISVADDDVLLVNITALQEPVALVDANAKTMTDGDKVCRLANLVGRYQYVSVMGAQKTLKKYEAVAPLTYNQFRYVLQTDGVFSFPQVATLIKRKRDDREQEMRNADLEKKWRMADQEEQKREAKRRNRERYRMKGPEDFR